MHILARCDRYALQVVQCPSCGVCYKVTQKRQLLSLEKSKSSAVSVSPTTKFWFILWAVVSVVLLFGESLLPAKFKFHSNRLSNQKRNPIAHSAAGGMSFLQTQGHVVTTGAAARRCAFVP